VYRIELAPDEGMFRLEIAFTFTWSLDSQQTRGSPATSQTSPDLKYGLGPDPAPASPNHPRAPEQGALGTRQRRLQADLKYIESCVPSPTLDCASRS
jgi:hypothetical protein